MAFFCLGQLLNAKTEIKNFETVKNIVSKIFILHEKRLGQALKLKKNLNY